MDGLALTTLDAVRRQLTLTSTQNLDNLLLTQTVHEASGYLQGWTKGRVFAPVYATRLFDDTALLDSERLDTDDDLLEVKSVTNGDGQTMAADAYRLTPLNSYPKGFVRTIASKTTWVYNGFETLIQVAGFWGYHDQYGSAWPSTGDLVTENPLTAAATTLAVASLTALNAYGLPRYEVLGYLRLEDEIVQIIALTGSSLTVRRGANGTPAASHAQNTPIQGYWPMPEAELAAKNLALWLYKTKQETGGSVQFADGTVVMSQAPKEVQLFAARYQKKRLRVLR